MYKSKINTHIYDAPNFHIKARISKKINEVIDSNPEDKIIIDIINDSVPFKLDPLSD